MKGQFSRDISTELIKKGLCDDVALYIEDMVRIMDFDAFKLDLMDAAYKFIIRKCDYFYVNDVNYRTINDSKFWAWIKYREVCFPNELGCDCCLARYSGVFCKKNWCKNQNCVCNQDMPDYTCDCGSPYRRHDETSQNCRDVNQPDYEYFQNQLKTKTNKRNKKKNKSKKHIS